MKCDRRSGGDCRGLPGGGEGGGVGKEEGRGGITAVMVTASTESAYTVPGPAVRLTVTHLAFMLTLIHDERFVEAF